MDTSKESGGASPLGDSTAGRELFFGTVETFNQYEAQAQACAESLENSESMRLIVLETWLFVDYVIRELLMTGFQLQRLDDTDLDLRYDLLPRSLRDCVRLVQKLRDVNRLLPARPEKPFTGRSRKWEHFDQVDPGLRERMGAAENSYFETFRIPRLDFASYLNKYRSVPEGWLEVAEQIDESWVKRVNKLNDARNLAAHCHEETRIAAKIGFSGPDVLVHVRFECRRLIEDLLGVSMKRDLAQSEAGEC